MYRQVRVLGMETPDVRVPLSDFGDLITDEPVQFGVALRVEYADGVVDSRYAGTVYAEKTAGGWRQNDAPAVDQTAVVRSDLPSPPGGEEVLKLAETRAELVATLHQNGITLPDAALLVNASDARNVSAGKSAAKTGGGGTLAMVTVNFCFNQLNHFGDSGPLEDVWPETSPTNRPAIGLFVALTGPGGATVSGYLNGSGCLGNTSVSTGSWSAKIYSYGVTPSVRLFVVRPCTPLSTCATMPAPPDLTVSVGNVTTSGTKTTNYNPGAKWEHFQTAAVASYALNRNPGSATAQYEIRTQAPSNGGGDPIWIGLGESDHKWVMGHEIGHRFLARHTPNIPWDSINLYDVNDGDPECESDVDTHSIASKEFSSSALNEAFASVYSALTWNNATAGADCWFEGGVDCELDATGYVLRWMETMCPGGPGQAADGGASPSMAGKGVEIDWLRTLWNVRTGGAQTAALSTMLQWIDSMPPPYTTTMAYTALDTSAGSFGGSLQSNWNSAKVTHGLDGLP